MELIKLEIVSIREPIFLILFFLLILVFVFFSINIILLNNFNIYFVLYIDI